MNLEELREARRTERERDGLQSLRDSFYRDVAAYVADLKAERDRAAAAADDPFSDPEVRRLSDEIESAEEIAESLYERRVGKVVDRASFAAADKRHETEGLTAEERDLFDDLVARIARNRERVLDSLDAPATDADATDATAATADDGTPTAPDDTAAADGPAADAPADETPDPSDLLAEAMGGGADAGSEAAADRDEPAAATPGTGDSSPDGPSTDGGTVPAGGADAPAADDAPAAERTTVYVTRDVGEIFGVDERTYRLAAEDVVDLPADNAEVLVERDAATPLE